jgi:hypothetical protein
VSARLARFDAVIELLDYMQAKGQVWFATAIEIARHVTGLIESGRWTPREERLPAYDSPLPELARRAG